MKSLFDYLDSEGISHPKNIRYIRYARFWLRLIGAWPSRAVGEETTTLTVFMTYFNFFLPAFCWCLMLAFVINHVRIWTFFEMGHAYINTILCTVYTARQFLPLTNKYEELVGQFINEIHLFHHKHRSDYAMKMHLYLHKLSHMYTIYIIGVMLWGYSLYNTIPLYMNLAGGGYGSHMPANFSYEYAIDYEVPFDYLRDLKIHIPMFIFNLYSGITCSTCFCVNDLFLSLQMFHLWGHLKILTHNMENFQMPQYKEDTSQGAYEFYTAEKRKDVSRRLKDIVEHHNLILRNRDKISETFGPSIAAYYVFHLLSNCVLLLELSDLDPKAVMRYGPLALINLQLQIQISAVFELLSSMTDKLICAAYTLPWERMDVANRRAVQLIIARCQRPLGLKAVGMIEVGIKTTASVLKTTLTYYVMLKTIATK